MTSCLNVIDRGILLNFCYVFRVFCVVHIYLHPPAQRGLPEGIPQAQMAPPVLPDPPDPPVLMSQPSPPLLQITREAPSSPIH